MNRLAAFTIAALFCFSGFSIAEEIDPQATPAARIHAIEQAHHASIYDQQSSVTADFEIKFGPMEARGEMVFPPSMGKVRMRFRHGHIVFFDGQTAWISDFAVSDATVKIPGPPARFHVLTWPYFLAAPYKLNDPGTRLSDAGMLPVREGQTLRGTKVTFDSGVGDTPDDWYIAFADPQTGRLSALAYIVTFGTSPEEAEQTPGIILYDDFVDIDGVPFATTWTFHHWNPTDGIHGEPKGHGKLTNLAFVERAAAFFEKPAFSVEAAMPGQQ